METITRGIFTVDDIHEIRVQMARERERMSPEEYKRKSDAEIAEVKRKLNQLRSERVEETAIL